MCASSLHLYFSAFSVNLQSWEIIPVFKLHHLLRNLFLFIDPVCNIYIQTHIYILVLALFFIVNIHFSLLLWHSCFSLSIFFFLFFVSTCVHLCLFSSFSHDHELSYSSSCSITEKILLFFFFLLWKLYLYVWLSLSVWASPRKKNVSM